MDYMNLGVRSRKTGLTVDKTIQKDEYSMENLDDFFKDEQESFIDMRRRSRKSSVLPNTGIRLNVAGAPSSFDNDGFKNASNIPERGTSPVQHDRTPDNQTMHNRRDSGLPQEFNEFPDIYAGDEGYADDVDGKGERASDSYRTPPKSTRKDRRFIRQLSERDEEEEDESISVRLTPVKRDLDDYRDIPDLIDDGDTTRDESFNTSENALLEDELDDNFRPGSEEEEEDRDYVEDMSGLGAYGSGSEDSTSDSDSEADDGALSDVRKSKRGIDSVSDTYDSDEEYIQTQAKDLLAAETPAMNNGIRRSNRVKVAPLEYWRNEKIVFKRKSEKPVLDIDKIITYDHDQDEEEEQLLKNKRTKKPIAKTKTRPYNYIPSGKPRGRPRKVKKTDDVGENDPNNTIMKDIKEGVFPNAEWLKQGILQSEVNVSADEKKEENILAFAPGLAQTEQVTSTSRDRFTLSILFDKHKERFASGMLKLPIDGEKTPAESYNAFINFYVTSGVVEVTLDDKKFVCTAGSTFQIPAFNNYGFINKGRTEALLFFVQITVPDDFNGADAVFEDSELSPTKSSSDMSLTST
ncbi:unnamed protein product [Kluyveromyces dobzhanskii CBS 2104]|uniref:WGS project CCBQ000000000 data, contig 00015 n=1 Tax=Kluyveromyces dobzhanskii CBS 2104 TaxID=1427455 RepID=A0A0A8LA57_9SACH|nr:unnamed protein product [Kluyveromyces dobzhanskii CBS 2104]